jgi:hypothetical protein
MTSSPRVVFSSIRDARTSTPFFIDEEGVGPWLSTDDPEILARGTVIQVARDALHIPTLQQDGRPIPLELRAEIEARAVAIGLTQTHRAIGYWTLSETGEQQQEAVTIATASQPIDQASLRDLAEFIISTANQEAVALEISGRVEQFFARSLK